MIKCGCSTSVRSRYLSTHPPWTMKVLKKVIRHPRPFHQKIRPLSPSTKFFLVTQSKLLTFPSQSSPQERKGHPIIKAPSILTPSESASEKGGAPSTPDKTLPTVPPGWKYFLWNATPTLLTLKWHHQWGLMAKKMSQQVEMKNELLWSIQERASQVILAQVVIDSIL